MRYTEDRQCEGWKARLPTVIQVRLLQEVNSCCGQVRPESASMSLLSLQLLGAGSQQALEALKYAQLKFAEDPFRGISAGELSDI